MSKYGAIITRTAYYLAVVEATNEADAMNKARDACGQADEELRDKQRRTVRGRLERHQRRQFGAPSSMSKHTPGPWAVEVREKGAWMSSLAICPPCEAENHEPCWGWWTEDDGGDDAGVVADIECECLEEGHTRRD